MKLSLGVGAMLVTAVLAGAAGGAVALSATQGGPAPAAPSVTLHQVAEEATSSPTPASSPEPVAPVVDESEADPAPVVHSAPVSEPAPKVVVMPKQETAEEAADRAKAEADRAKEEADRAEKAAAPTAPKPVTEPVVAPEPKPEGCASKSGIAGLVPVGSTYDERYESAGHIVTWKCTSEGWKAVKTEKIPPPPPPPTCEESADDPSTCPKD